MSNYRKGDILTIWAFWAGRKIDEQLVIVKNVDEVGPAKILRYVLKSLKFKDAPTFYWTEKEIDRQAELCMPASELASILYE